MIRGCLLRSSLTSAFRGLVLIYREEQNFRIHSLCAILVLLFAVVLHIPIAHILVLILTTALVLIVEIINTALERFLDVIKPRMSPYVGQIKDIMAGLVLLSAWCAALVGILVFSLPLWSLFKYAIALVPF
ncbi:MAG: diacylglycerol kinase family protein [bacterium]|nr:diacylglycerol kinase family protein [bacterium]